MGFGKNDEDWMEDKNWFRRHWVVSIFLGLFVVGVIGMAVDSENSGITGNAVQGKYSEKTVSTSDTEDSERVKYEESDFEEELEKIAEETDKALEEIESGIKETVVNTQENAEADIEDPSDLNVYGKQRLCGELCAGEDIDIPVVKTECLSSCIQVYYYTGEEGLDEYIEELRG